ncbi:TFIP11 [Caenorhabditis elegans]|uniref:TFIP11 n=1 Tax=Caenorhabditis elegans TaxID=6239 RepID=Q18358_CAEEL|nr:TFIP11 [Caenorhabditis elegans]CAA92788.1 TFIP11 [Caenorhabditis elegans]|eukprot:NP_501685.1 Uncharacterized protein CELE_C33A12.4 [Caenorhabditis elegans]
MSDQEDKEVPDVEVDYSKYDEDSVPIPEKDIEESHPGRPDLDYDETPVGPAPTECTEEKND